MGVKPHIEEILTARHCFSPKRLASPALTASAIAGCVLLGCSGAFAQAGAATPAGGRSYEATPQRPTFTAGTATTAPGTLELEFGASGTTHPDGFLAFPSTLKYTPAVDGGLLDHTEFSVGFDLLTNAPLMGGGSTRFGDTLAVVIRRPVYRHEHFSFAVAPRATFFLRGERGARAGMRALAAWESGPNSVTANVTWTGSTAPSPTNPSEQHDFATDYSRTLGESGWRNRTVIFAGVLAEKPASQHRRVSLGEGVSYRVWPNWVLDFAVRQHGLAAGPSNYEVLGGFTLNLGRIQ